MADVHIDKLLTNPDFMALMDLAAQAVSDMGHSTPALSFAHAAAYVHMCMHFFLTGCEEVQPVTTTDHSAST